ncbi:MAG: hypothetical protein WDN24_21335 [Sphingomonas sp.]
MSADEPLEPVRSPLGANLLAILLAFAGGAAVMAGAAWFYGGFPARQPTLPPAIESVKAPHAAPQQILPPATDVATLSAREAELAGKLDRLEARLRDVDGGVRDAAGYATQAERLMIAFSVRRAIERGQPLGPLEMQLRRRFGEAQGEAVATIVQASGQPVTLEDLRLALDTIAPRLGSAPDESWWAGVRRVLGDLVVLRQSDSPSPRPADRLRRARRTLEEGQVEAALAEVAHMPGVDAAQSWVIAAKRYVASREALRAIEVAAMQTPAAR